MGLYSKLEIFQCFSIYIQIRTHSYSYIQQDIYKLGDFFFFFKSDLLHYSVALIKYQDDSEEKSTTTNQAVSLRA